MIASTESEPRFPKADKAADVAGQALPHAGQTRQNPWLIACLSLCIGLGVVFRFTDLDRRPYWCDEACTSQRVFGHGIADIEARYFHGGEITAGDFNQVQKKSERHGILDSIVVDAALDPKHPPLYFLLARIWAEVAGDSIV